MEGEIIGTGIENGRLTVHELDSVDVEDDEDEDVKGRPCSASVFG
jgi:hypothetical protein